MKTRRLCRHLIALNCLCFASSVSAVTLAELFFAKKDDGTEPRAASPADLLLQGKLSGDLRFFNFSPHNSYFSGKNTSMTTVGTQIGFETAPIKGFSVKLAYFGQRGLTGPSDIYKATSAELAPDVDALGEAYLQWQNDNLRLRVGDQKIDAPYLTPDFRVLPASYRGITFRAGDEDDFLEFMRVFRYKDIMKSGFHKRSRYSFTEAPGPVGTHQRHNGFWGLGMGKRVSAGHYDLSGQAWFFEYLDYTRMLYTEGRAHYRGYKAVTPFIGLQFLRERDTGRAVMGRVDSHVYGGRLGLQRNSWQATLNYNYIPHRRDAFFNGAPLAPYSHDISSGPLFAQPMLNSAQDMGSGNAFSVDINGDIASGLRVGGRYSYMALSPAAHERTTHQSEYMAFLAYEFGGELEGLSLSNHFAYQTQNVHSHDFYENRFELGYSF